jgi:hypothetical protein
LKSDDASARQSGHGEIMIHVRYFWGSALVDEGFRVTDDLFQTLIREIHPVDLRSDASERYLKSATDKAS